MNESHATEENLCYMLQEYWEQAMEKMSHITGVTKYTSMPINPVGFVKGFLKEDTLVETKYYEVAKQRTLEKDAIDVDFKV